MKKTSYMYSDFLIVSRNIDAVVHPGSLGLSYDYAVKPVVYRYESEQRDNMERHMERLHEAVRCYFRERGIPEDTYYESVYVMRKSRDKDILLVRNFSRSATFRVYPGRKFSNSDS